MRQALSSEKSHSDGNSQTSHYRRDCQRYSRLDTARLYLPGRFNPVPHTVCTFIIKFGKGGSDELITKNVETTLEQKWTLGERLADKIATFGGSWTFLICFAIFLGLWITINTVVMVTRPTDPYPFILLNLILSCLAAIQAPIIMMSQNRQEAKDRLRSQNDYQINLKAELEIQHLHEKLDHLLLHQWERLAQIQEIQLDLLSEMSKKD